MRRGERTARSGRDGGGGPWARLPLYPVCLALFPVLSLAAHNVEDVPLGEWAGPALVIVVTSAAAVGALALALRKPGQAAFVSAVLVVFFLYYGHATELLPSLTLALPAVSLEDGFALRAAIVQIDPPHFVWIDDRASDFDLFFLPVWMSAAAAALVLGLRRGRDWAGNLRALNLTGLLLIALPGFGLLQHALPAGGSGDGWRSAEVPALAPDGEARNIYYLIFDRYGSERVLADAFGFSNREFVADLESRGFYIASDAHANYPQTMHSLASSLNMEFLDEMAEELRRARDLSPLLNRMENHRVGAILRRAGYSYHHGGAWWSHSRGNRSADVVFRVAMASEFVGELMDLTVLTRAVSTWFGGSGVLRDALATAGLSRLARWRYARTKFDWLEQIPSRPEPTFTLAHFLLPHKPYIFDRHGDFVTRSEELRRSRSDNYLEQVRFVNRRVLRLVDEILARSETPPIIILQADEGPYPDRFYSHQGGPTAWRDATADELRMKLGILNAYYLPGRDSLPLHPGITPVNTFRIVFNEYFGADYELLPDRSFVFSGDFHEFWDVTDLLASRCPAQAPAGSAAAASSTSSTSSSVVWPRSRAYQRRVSR